jgi:hypothetical protein
VNDRTAAVRRRYSSLGFGELVAAAVFAYAGVQHVGPWAGGGAQSLALWSALVPLLFVLGQAGAYWLLARRWTPDGRMPRAIAALYRAFRVLDPLVLAAGLVGVLTWLPASGIAATVVLLIWLFGVIEYVNYFAIRLSYPLAEWFGQVWRRRTPRLVRDLRATAARR